MHLLFLAPDTGPYNAQFVRGLKQAGAFVSGVGHKSVDQLAPQLRALLDHYQPVRNLFDSAGLLQVVLEIQRKKPIDRIETIDEPVVGPAAKLREELQLPGMRPEQATLCRDKVAMKEFLRRHGLPCAASAAAETVADVEAFAEREGYPLIVKPREGFGTLETFRCDDRAALDKVLGKLELKARPRRLVIEEFISGHEGFYDALVIDKRPALDFAAHYYPTCLEAIQERSIKPQIAVTNRIEQEGYRELRDVGAKLIAALDLDRSATHMEWFFGPKGLKIGEIGARPAGERIWDFYRVANDIDVYAAWGSAIVQGRVDAVPSRRLAAGSVQIRPDRDGRVRGYTGLEELRRALGDAIYEWEVPPVGSPTAPLDKGWHVNTWFRMSDPDYDRLRRMLEFAAQTVKVSAG